MKGWVRGRDRVKGKGKGGGLRGRVFFRLVFMDGQKYDPVKAMSVGIVR